MNPTIEKRQYPRHRVSIQGFFSSGEMRGEEGIVQDLSSGGCRMASDNSLSFTPGATIELQLRPRQQASIFIPSAMVRWTAQSSFGVQFLTVTEQESNRLTQLLRTLTA